ncbi:MAG: PilZ domain-containing protein [Candidatus Omnitrophota bacterium]
MKNKKITDSEKRKYLRFGYPFFIRIRKKGGKGGLNRKEQSVITFKEFKENNISISKNISVEGICFTTSKDYPLNTLVLLEVFSPTRKVPFNMLAKIRWRKERVIKSSLKCIYDIGVEFLKIDADGEFHDLLEQLVNSKLEKILL